MFFSKALFTFNPQKANYAVVTGASDGIGKAYSIEMAKRGYNVVLIARSLKKLQNVAIECQAFGVETVIISFDFAKATQSQWSDLKKQLDVLNIGVLINNVGVNHSIPVSFLEESQENCEMINTVNINSLMKMTRIVMPQMVKRQHGLVLNMGSMLAKVPSGLLSVYSGSKAFVRQWSQCIAEEVKEFNVHVEHINTMLVQTAMSKVEESSYVVPTPDQFASKTLERIGYGYDSTLYPGHALVNRIVGFFPLSTKRKAFTAENVAARKKALMVEDADEKTQ